MDPRLHQRPDMDTYFMLIALAVRERANCLGNRVGAILVVGVAVWKWWLARNRNK